MKRLPICILCIFSSLVIISNSIAAQNETASFNPATNTLQIHYLEIGDGNNYWLDLQLVSMNTFQFNGAIGTNSSCYGITAASFVDGELYIPYMLIGDQKPVWMRLKITQASPLQFSLASFGVIGPALDGDWNYKYELNGQEVGNGVMTFESNQIVQRTYSNCPENLQTKSSSLIFENNQLSGSYYAGCNPGDPEYCEIPKSESPGQQRFVPVFYKYVFQNLVLQLVFLLDIDPALILNGLTLGYYGPEVTVYVFFALLSLSPLI